MPRMLGLPPKISGFTVTRLRRVSSITVIGCFGCISWRTFCSPAYCRLKQARRSRYRDRYRNRDSNFGPLQLMYHLAFSVPPFEAQTHSAILYLIQDAPHWCTDKLKCNSGFSRGCVKSELIRVSRLLNCTTSRKTCVA